MYVSMMVCHVCFGMMLMMCDVCFCDDDRHTTYTPYTVNMVIGGVYVVYKRLWLV